MQDASLIYDIRFISDYFKKIPAIQFILTTVDEPSITRANCEVVEPVNIFLPTKRIEELTRGGSE